MRDSGLVDELSELETETFEIEDHAEVGENMASCSTACSCCSSCSSCSSCSAG